MKKPYYPSEPLDDGQFRLLKLYPGQEDEALECNLLIRSLRPHPNADGNKASQYRAPEPYEALSYTWGEAGDDELFVKILSKNEPHRVSVRPSLESALRQLRNPNEPKFFWVDALCINQEEEDQSEKNSQIPEMSQIYNNAETVCIWLGIHENDSDRAMKFIKQCLNLENLDKLVEDASYSRDWAALSTLMRRPWFSRRWIVQEIAVAKAAILHCGDSMVPWQEFAHAISLFSSNQNKVRQLLRQSRKFHNHPDYLGDVTELGATRLVATSENIFRKSDDGLIMEHMSSLEYLMSTLSNFEATDPHDIVYAIIWLSRDARPQSKKRLGEPRNVYSPIPNSETSSPHSPRSTFDVEPGSIYKLNTKNPNIHRGRQEGTSLDIITRPALKKDRRNTMPGETSLIPFRIQDGMEPTSVHPKRGYGTGPSIGANKNALNETKIPQFSEVISCESVERQAGFDFPTPIKNEDVVKKVVAKWTDSYLSRGITIDYKKSVFEVCRDFLAFTIHRSESLDMICFPWAPDDPGLPSWIPRLSDKAYGLCNDNTYRRINADPLVGSPGSGRRHYNAFPNTKARLKSLGSTDTSLTVSGFVFDKIRYKQLPAIGGVIPSQWLIAGGWDNTSTYPRDHFWRTLVGNRDTHGQKPPPHWKIACRDAFSRRPAGGALNTGEILTYECPSATKDFVERVQHMVWGRRMVILCQSKDPSRNDSPEKSLGLAPSKCKKGDLVCILSGCSVPVLLRKFVDNNRIRTPADCTCHRIDCQCNEKGGSNSGPNNREAKVHYRFIGECYVHGMMDGEANGIVKEKELPKQEFEIR